MDEQERAKMLASYPPDTDWFLEFVEARQDATKYKEACLRKDDEMNTLTVDNARLREDNNEYAQINGMMQRLLIQTAKGLKGEPKELHWHDWSDLPEVAERAVAELKALQEAMEAIHHVLDIDPDEIERAVRTWQKKEPHHD